MKQKIFYFILLVTLLITGCSKEIISITPETLIVGAEESSAVVKTSGFSNCEILFPEKSQPDVSLWRDYENSYDGEWFKVVISDDWRDLHFQFDKNAMPEQRSAEFQLSFGDIFNRLTVVQQGVD